ncbi:MAG: DUF4178 domain-containing protein [Gammaproteobacteria bacterium]|nr:DUF4178 domain-containing protein [Gammaproteobacteria bacterium]
MNTQLRSINCTACGAPLSLHGGHRVESIACGYCGSVLDATDGEYSVLQTYTRLERPAAPLSLGMQGTIKGVAFTVIGVVEYRDTDFGKWLEFAIFSPTHGYAWLEYDHGHFVFSRRVRDLPESEIIARAKTPFYAKGHEFQVFSHYVAVVAFVEGELTYVASIGDRIHLIDGIAPPYIYTVERTEEEVEYLFGEYLPAEEVLESFGVTDWPYKPHGVHPGQVYKPSSSTRGLWLSGLICSPIAVLLLLHTLLAGGGSVVLDRDMRPVKSNGPIAQNEHTFAVKSPGDLLSLEMSIARREPWTSLDTRIYKDGSKEAVFSLNEKLKPTEFANDKYWRTANTQVQTFFILPEAGIYTLRTIADFPQNARQTTHRRALRVTVREGIKLSRYYFILLLLSVGALFAGPLSSLAFESKRWHDELDDDGDDD